ncbi:hypothetical protein QIH87_49980 (plasmid) [Bradyrhizobium elkanii]|uniref:hypothetical protein n=1 Tax=Bradyrhizobium elkanii TaxID=29448 RepID=UPI002226A2B2|nr:hypothetical protein [Bradyrhizobium elkanii]MCW2228056.1 hypothetical protein [Bradyrhizobium elkanii]WLB14761.1 hypothetical protein QIH87_49980 [Bradyrhizobium elkanii]WLB69048.1 hypothetical protein QIH89_27425 [Bradyrhizobium elkanii]
MTTEPKFKIKIPQTLDQSAKIRKWLEQIAHKTASPARNFVSNLIYQIKATESEADLLRPEKQAQMAYQAKRLAEAGNGPQ